VLQARRLKDSWSTKCQARKVAISECVAIMRFDNVTCTLSFSSQYCATLAVMSFPSHKARAFQERALTLRRNLPAATTKPDKSKARLITSRHALGMMKVTEELAQTRCNVVSSSSRGGHQRMQTLDSCASCRERLSRWMPDARKVQNYTD
jgi:hypothetical protein